MSDGRHHHNMAANPAGTHPGGMLPGPAPNTAGPHTRDILNKMDPTVDAQSGGTQVLGPGTNVTQHGHGQHHSGHAGHHHQHGAPPLQRMDAGAQQTAPHSSNLANKLDPRVNTDNQGYAGHQGHTGDPSYTPVHGHTAPAHHGMATNTPQGTAPHSSNLANKLDPRVNTDNQGYTNNQGYTDNQGLAGHQQVHPAHPSYTPVHGQGRSGHHGMATNAPPPGAAGPHSSNLANKLDPRVNTDNQGYTDNQGFAPAHGQNAPVHGHDHGHNTAGYHQNVADHHRTAMHTSQGTAEHSSHAANVLDPRINTNDPAYSGGNQGYATNQVPAHAPSTTIHQGPIVQPGPASKTAGPHKSNLLNKLNPTVDSKATVSQQREYRIS